MSLTMSDATLPPPRSSSVEAANSDGNRSDSSNAGIDYDTSLILSGDIEAKDEGVEGRLDGKQKRKRTRYVRPTDP